MFIEDIEAPCRRVIAGDTEALQELGLDNATYPRPTPANTSQGSLQVSYSSVLNTAVAARELQFSFIEKQCEVALELLRAIADAKHISLQHHVDGEDVVEIMMALIDEQRRLKSIHPDSNEADYESEEEQAAGPQPSVQTNAANDEILDIAAPPPVSVSKAVAPISSARDPDSHPPETLARIDTADDDVLVVMPKPPASVSSRDTVPYHSETRHAMTSLQHLLPALTLALKAKTRDANAPCVHFSAHILRDTLPLNIPTLSRLSPSK